MATSTYHPGVRDSHLSLLTIVHNNLSNQADWKDIERHTSESFARPVLSGKPPDPIYADPNDPSSVDRDQIEWVLPIDLREKWSLRKSAEVFDSLPEGVWGTDKSGQTRKKRILLAVVAEDSTVVYYVMHDGIVKPRQN